MIEIEDVIEDLFILLEELLQGKTRKELIMHSGPSDEEALWPCKVEKAIAKLEEDLAFTSEIAFEEGLIVVERGSASGKDIWVDARVLPAMLCIAQGQYPHAKQHRPILAFGNRKRYKGGTLYIFDENPPAIDDLPF